MGHEGQCFTDDLEVAITFAGSHGKVFRVEMDLESLVWEECEGYDHDTNECLADNDGYRSRACARGVDVLAYDDEDECGRSLTCWRILSHKAIEMVRTSAQALSQKDLENL
tara:strand:+ start:34813 stop:35145 length:333 start_codon:yes stop_codon:yes gene_type:complete